MLDNRNYKIQYILPFTNNPFLDLLYIRWIQDQVINKCMQYLWLLFIDTVAPEYNAECWKDFDKFLLICFAKRNGNFEPQILWNHPLFSNQNLNETSSTKVRDSGWTISNFGHHDLVLHHLPTKKDVDENCSCGCVVYNRCVPDLGDSSGLNIAD